MRCRYSPRVQAVATYTVLIERVMCHAAKSGDRTCYIGYMTEEQRESERARLQKFKDAGLIHDFTIRENDVTVTLLAPAGAFEAVMDAAKRITAFTPGLQK
jgi:hypothetical protein